TTGRDRACEDVVGYFVNPVVLRADLAGDPAFAAHLAKTREAVAGALQHRGLPFPVLAGRLQPVRDPGRPPVFQAWFVLQRAAPGQEADLAAFALGQAGSRVERVEIEGLALESFAFDPGTAQFDLALFAAEVGDALALSCEYASTLFDGVTIGRWLGHLETLLDAAVAHPEARLAELPLLTGSERHQLLREWSDTAAAYRFGRPLHAWIEDQVDRTPEAVAVSFEGEALSYGELDRRANGLARRLRALSVGSGVGPESRVAVCLERSAELVIALLAVLKAGGAYVPLDPLPAPEDRSPSFVSLQSLMSFAPEGGDRLPESCASDQQLAYMIYTSGSTGRPKGAMVGHRSICNRLLWMQDAYGLTAADTVLQKTPFSFDV